MERKFPKLGWQQASKKHAKGTWTMAMEPDRYEKVPVLGKNGEPRARLEQIGNRVLLSSDPSHLRRGFLGWLRHDGNFTSGWRV